MLDALEGLIEIEDIGNITLAHMSQAADVPAASMYHFFPSMDAALTALAERYFDALFLFLDSWVPVSDSGSWQERLFQLCDQTRDYYESNPSALKAHFGPATSRALHQLKVENNWRLANSLLCDFRREFDPYLSQEWHERLMQAIHINESFWSLSCARFGLISDRLAAEGKRAAAAYLKLYSAELPERSLLTPPETKQNGGIYPHHHTTIG